jgi:hypothetical protein
MTITDQIVQDFDPTDANASSDVAFASVKVLQYVARALWAEHHGMRMGRDDSRELGVALNHLAASLRLLPSRWNGADSDALYARLLAETGIVEPKEPPKRPTIAELDAILNSGEDAPIIINPDGSITA